jgi:endonuclease/exonuclease/phosphatase family metal-dependent hydrolase
MQPMVPVNLRIMTFNIWVGGELVDFSKTLETIRASNADIVGLQEPTGNTQRIAEELGWYASERLHIVSRFPLIDPPDSDGNYIYAQIMPGQVIALANVHLTSNPYGPYAVRDGETLEAVIALEEGLRLPEIVPVLDSLKPLIDTGMPVFLTGDFNTPSHLDWIEAMVGARDAIKYPVMWPVTVAVEAAGFVDTFRAAHPDPVANPGITWTYGYPYPRLAEGEALDRIDLVFAANAIETLSSEIVGPAGSPDVDIAIQPFGSDHRAVVSTVRVLPVVPPPFVAAQARLFKQGDLLVVRYHALAGEDTDRITIVPAGGDALEDGLMWLPPYEASFFGSVTFGTGTLVPGVYEAVLMTSDDTEVSRNAFWVIARDAVPTIKTSKAVFAAGEPIEVAWANTPAMRRDWVGIYAAGDGDLYNNYYAYVYTNATVDGSAVFDAALLGDEMLPAGDYVVRLLLDDGYSVIAETAFSVTE